MPRLPALKPKDAIRALEKAGFLIKQSGLEIKGFLELL